MVSTRGFPTERGRPLRVLVDGRCRDLIEVVDQGLQYGDGLFETLRMRDGAPCQWQRRLDRLAFGAGRLGMPSPDLERLHTEIADAARGLDDGVLKLILTRGSGGRGYRPPDSPQPPTHPAHLCVAYTAPFGSWEEGVMVRYCRTPATINPALAGIKHLNRLDSVLASREWSDPTIAEGLMLDPFGGIVGGTRTNLFLWDGARLLTPPVDHCGIAGTRRDLLMDLAAQAGLDCVESRLEPADLYRARGVFLTNAIVGIWPVRELAGRSFDLTDLPWDLLDAVRQAAHTPG